MIRIEKVAFNGQYSYKDFNFIIKIIQKKWGLEGEGYDNDLSITSSKVFIDTANIQSQLISDFLKNMVENIKESLRVYADYKKRVCPNMTFAFNQEIFKSK